MLRQLLISAYTRLDDRDLYAEILDAHLRDRRKTMVSRLDLHGQITFGDTALQLGPAFDKSEVSKTDSSVPEQKMIEPNKPKWEGTKIVKSSSKKFGTFGSGGRRDALKAAQARKAKLAGKATSDW